MNADSTLARARPFTAAARSSAGKARPLLLSLACAGALVLGGCSLLPKPGPGAAPGESPSADTAPGSEASERRITAQTPAVRAYRKEGARHLYKQYARQIYKGRLPPLVYAVVVVETDIDADGQITQLTFGRTPGHAPEVPPRIESLIRAAAPFPKPSKIGPHTYVDTWLWDKSGRFQIDTLTEGQRSR